MLNLINSNFKYISVKFCHLLPFSVQTHQFIYRKRILQFSQLQVCFNHRRDFTQSKMFKPKDGELRNACSFKVVSYNVLAQYLLEAHRHLYRACAPSDLIWDVRSNLLYREIISLDPDILCLQEVQAQHLHTFYKKFEDLGYFGVFKKRTGSKDDGCAIYFKKSVFALQEHLNVEFNQQLQPKILNRDNIGIMVKLAPHCMPNTPIIVATTHLLYNPRREDVRLAQMQLLLAEIDRFRYSQYDDDSAIGPWPVILTGDFNSMPSSWVIDLVSQGCSAKLRHKNVNFENIGITDSCEHLASCYLRETYNDFITSRKFIKIQNSEYKGPSNNTLMKNRYYAEISASSQSERFDSQLLTHNLKLKSVYNHINDEGDTEATTYQDKWVTVDYIYYSFDSTLTLTDKLQLPCTEECKGVRSLPNHRNGSDHLSLGAVFELKYVEPTILYKKPVH